MSKLNLQNGKCYGLTLMAGNRFGIAVMTLTAAYLIPPDSPHVLVLDPGGAGRNVDLPANPKPGDWFWIINGADAAEVLTIRNAAGGALVPPATPTQNESTLLVYIDATYGWRNLTGIGV